MKKGLLIKTFPCGLSPLALADVTDFDGLDSGIEVDDEYAPLVCVSAQNPVGDLEVAVV